MNKTKMIAFAGLALAILGSAAFVTESSVAQVLPGTAPSYAQAKHQRGEKHPDLRAALNLLRRAHARLQNGARDFGGHRAAAEKLTEQAIDQVQAAMKADKN